MCSRARPRMEANAWCCVRAPDYGLCRPAPAVKQQILNFHRVSISSAPYALNCEHWIEQIAYSHKLKFFLRSRIVY